MTPLFAALWSVVSGFNDWSSQRRVESRQITCGEEGWCRWPVLQSGILSYAVRLRRHWWLWYAETRDEDNAFDRMRMSVLKPPDHGPTCWLKKAWMKCMEKNLATLSINEMKMPGRRKRKICLFNYSIGIRKLVKVETGVVWMFYF